MPEKTLIGFTYGDPSGIGPEILSSALMKVLTSLGGSKKIYPVIIGDKGLLCFNKSIFEKCFFYEIPVDKKTIISKPNKQTGIHALRCLRAGIKLIKEKKIKFLITGPVSKQIISLSSPNFLGQTEIIAKEFNLISNKLIMLFVSKDLKVSLLTRHLPVSEISKKISIKSILEHVILLNAELKRWFKIKNPKIALLGLNPHAGENGLIGLEEIKYFKQAVKILKKKKINVVGPLSPDGTLAKAGQNYLKGNKQEFDAYVSIYHDQALPMFKAVSGLSGLNITLGLPFLRVSPDHGTAFDIAGKKKASDEGIISAVKFVEQIACCNK